MGRGGRGGVEDAGGCVLNGDFETRLLFRTCLKLEEERRTTPAPRWMTGESRLAILRGDVTELELEVEDIEPGCEDAQPIPDSRRIDDLIGSGEFERRRSRRGADLWVWVAMQVNYTTDWCRSTKEWV